MKADRKVGPWLIHAIRHATRRGSDGNTRFAVAMLTSGGPDGQHAMTTLDGMARRLIPGGHIDPAWHNPVLRLTTATHHGKSTATRVATRNPPPCPTRA